MSTEPVTFGFAMLLFGIAAVATSQASDATVDVGRQGALVVKVGSATILTSKAKRADVTSRAEERPAEPVYLGYPHGPKTAEFIPAGRTARTLVVSLPTGISAQIWASGDSFACSDDPTAPVGSTFGPASGSRTNAVYDRSADWLLSAEGDRVSVDHLGGGRYTLSAAGPCTLRVRADYYRNHLGYFLWDRSKPLWTKPVAGWCSWMAHLQEVTEKDVRAAARFFSDNLKAYGYDVIQIDDGYQRVLQFMRDGASIDEPLASYLNKPNDKFPSGLAALAKEISGLGLTPGIWVGDYLPLGLAHAEGYVTGTDGKPLKGPWVNYAVNALMPEAADEAYLQTVRGLYGQGWRYFKIDTLRHVLYDNYRKAPDYWKSRNETPEDAFRALLSKTKKEIGRDVYMLACWGTMPEMAGIPDGCRIGEDVGPDAASMRRTAKYIAQFQHLNNVVWHNDPDYMCLRVPIDQARAWATLTFLAGGHLMVSDPIPAYDAARVDILRRVGPPIFTRPAVVAPQKPDPEWMTLAAEKEGRRWLVAARFAWADLQATQKPLAELGLDPGREYLAFDFWNEHFVGLIGGSAPFTPLKEGSCQVMVLQPSEGRPQVLATNRHLGQGAHELSNVRWTGSELTGRFLRAPGRQWSLYLYVPRGWSIKSVTPGLTSDAHGEVLKLTFPQGSTAIDWRVEFSRGHREEL